MRTILAVAALVLAPTYAQAQSSTPPSEKLVLTAACKDPKGYSYRYPADSAKPPAEYKDGYTEVTWYFSWESAAPNQATVMTQSSKSAGSAPHSAKAAAIVTTDGSVLTFVVPYEAGAWIYTLFPASKLMFASRHMLGTPTESGTGALFHARCEMSVR